jgi:hypothetical protein
MFRSHLCNSQARKKAKSMKKCAKPNLALKTFNTIQCCLQMPKNGKYGRGTDRWKAKRVLDGFFLNTFNSPLALHIPFMTHLTPFLLSSGLFQAHISHF